jgi:mRNA-degrading endonuclease RelE of RelBE toxin-antitoxin system
VINPTENELDNFVYYKLQEDIKNSPNNGHSPRVNDALSGKYKLIYYRYGVGRVKVMMYVESEEKEVGVCIFDDTEFDNWLRETKLSQLIS